jgi:hypothetical protein
LKRILSFFFAAALLVSLCAPASAEYTWTYFHTIYGNYSELYRDSYVPMYHSYNESLDELADWIRSAEITTQEQVDIIFAFLHEIKSEKNYFYGDRDTPGTSRYDVPLYRNAMHEAIVNKDCDTAVYYLQCLTTSISDRTDFIQYEINKINDFIGNPYSPGTYTIADVFVLIGTPTVTLDGGGDLIYTYDTLIDGALTDLRVFSYNPLIPPSIEAGLYLDIPINNGLTGDNYFVVPQASVTAISLSGGTLTTTGGTCTISFDTTFFIVEGSMASVSTADEIICTSSASPYTGNSELLVVAPYGFAETVFILL